MNITKLRNKAINKTITVLSKARAPQPVEALFTKATKLETHELNLLVALISSELDDRKHNLKTCYQCEKEVKYLFDDSRCKDCTAALEGDTPC